MEIKQVEQIKGAIIHQVGIEGFVVQYFLLNCLKFIFIKKNKLILLTVEIIILVIIRLLLHYLITFRYIQL
jgi:hypothetical protein